MKIQTDNGYTIEFPKGLDLRSEAEMSAPYRGDTVAIPFVIRGEPGLIDVRFQVQNVEDKDQDCYNETFTSVLRPGGIFTNFFGRAHAELRGELTVPKRLFPIEVHAVSVRNLSDAQRGTIASAKP